MLSVVVQVLEPPKAGTAVVVTTLTASNPATTSGRILLKLCSFTRIVAPFLFPLMLKWRVVMLWVEGALMSITSVISDEAKPRGYQLSVMS